MGFEPKFSIAMISPEPWWGTDRNPDERPHFGAGAPGRELR